MHDEDEQPAVVIDNGSESCKAGFAGDDLPRISIPCLVGRPRASVRRGHVTWTHDTGRRGREEAIGEEAERKRAVLTLRHPVQHGIVTYWDDMEKIWQHIFHDELRISPDERPLLLTEPAVNPKPNREMMTRMMFETFSAPAVYVCSTSTLSLYASGRTTGTVIESGHGVTHTVPLYEGYPLPHAIRKTDTGGSDITEYLRTIMREKECYLDMKNAQALKEDKCEIAYDYDSEMNTLSNTTYQLPDGEHVSIGSERFRCTEALFRPSLMGVGNPGLHEMMNETIQECDEEVRKDLYGNTVLSGGNTMFRGIAERLTKEVVTLNPPELKVNIVAPPERKYSAWIGGSILASLSTFEEKWMTKYEYDENGPSLVHKKCF